MSAVTESMLARVRTKLLDVPGVRDAFAVPVGDEIEPIVIGGDDQEIREALFRSVPAGITTRGDVVGEAKDRSGKGHVFRFSRSDPR